LNQGTEEQIKWPKPKMKKKMNTIAFLTMQHIHFFSFLHGLDASIYFLS